MKTQLMLLALAALSLTALAADITGTWKAEFNTQRGLQKYTFTLKQAGKSVTGKASAEREGEKREAELKEGKVEGDTVTFVEPLKIRDNEINITYTGKISGNEIKFTRKAGDFGSSEATAKREGASPKAEATGGASTNAPSARASIAQPAGGRPGEGRGGNLDPGIIFTRPTNSPGLGQPMELPKPDADGFIAMFNGKDLSGWDALPNFWSVKEGAIDCVQTSEPGGNVQSNLIWMDSQQHPEKYANFELRVKFRWVSHSGNSGVQFRSVMDRPDTKHIGGYQADLDPRNSYTGAIYDESGKTGRRQKEQRALHMAPRGFKTTYPSDGGVGKMEPLAENPQTLAALVKLVGGEFNDLVIVAKGPHITIKVNDHVFCEMIDENPGALKNGIIAFQQHAGGQMEVQFKEPKIKFLPAKP